MISLLLSTSCSEVEEDIKENGVIELEGIWKLSPTITETTLNFTIEPGYGILETKENKATTATRRFILLSDGKGVRIQDPDSSTPLGYFLFSDRKGDAWVGIWDEELVRLIRQK
jgi:hypothetical protein